MATINNSDTIKRMLDDAKIQTSIDSVPRELGKTVVPVLVANPERIVNVVETRVSADTNANQEVYNTGDKQFYLTYAHLSYSKDAGADGKYISLSVNINNVEKKIIYLGFEPTTAGNDKTSVTFNPPIKLSKNSKIYAKSDSATASIDFYSSIAGFEVED